MNFKSLKKQNNQDLNFKLKNKTLFDANATNKVEHFYKFIFKLKSNFYFSLHCDITQVRYMKRQIYDLV